jgi:hypothetical protein
MADVNVTNIGALWLDRGASSTWWWEPVAYGKARWITAVPQILYSPNPTPDQAIEVANVFYILKGSIHAVDGTGGAGDLQLNVTFSNPFTDRTVAFYVYMGEAG